MQLCTLFVRMKVYRIYIAHHLLHQHNLKKCHFEVAYRKKGSIKKEFIKKKKLLLYNKVIKIALQNFNDSKH